MEPGTGQVPRRRGLAGQRAWPRFRTPSDAPSRATVTGRNHRDYGVGAPFASWPLCSSARSLVSTRRCRSNEARPGGGQISASAKPVPATTQSSWIQPGSALGPATTTRNFKATTPADLMKAFTRPKAAPVSQAASRRFRKSHRRQHGALIRSRTVKAGLSAAVDHLHAATEDGSNSRGPWPRASAQTSFIWIGTRSCGSQMTYFDDGRARRFGRMPGQLFRVRLDVIAWTKAPGSERLSDGPRDHRGSSVPSPCWKVTWCPPSASLPECSLR